jgi:hypothetical protein
VQTTNPLGGVNQMPWAVAIVVVALTVLAGSPWLLSHRADRLAKLHFIKMRRIRLRAR